MFYYLTLSFKLPFIVEQAESKRIEWCREIQRNTPITRHNRSC